LEEEANRTTIMLEANSVQLLSFEPKVVKKVHPGAERSILRSGGSSSEAGSLQAHPGALEDHPRALETLPGSY
jgi:hypothetical protein